ncbi:TRAP transporter small permease subunit [Dethiobacter alkaliphilus]|uniref:Tripartite ATP-independent periplasmic transporter DctQ component n=1 Tax=Dethiobacter alkaliphilus AHT 1 TaxID=555088 RepID=C0GJZ0_DETAL|nr:TRAP transporter small permease [Dethiobacter alkaliphilus]EEG76359.1 Tripartite ATP-independent periplasmic transporter DctQ component [Dethiobacter alkaliphilus AHT 1]
MEKIEKFVKALTLRTAQVSQIALVFTVIIVVANVVSRRIWSPIPGTVELVEMSGAILLAMAVAYTAINKGHIMVGVLVERFPPRIQAIVDLVVNAIALFFIYLLARETFVYAGRMMERGYSTGLLRLPIAPSIYLVAVGFAMLGLVLLLDFLKAAIIAVKGSESNGAN